MSNSKQAMSTVVESFKFASEKIDQNFNFFFAMLFVFLFVSCFSKVVSLLDVMNYLSKLT